MAQYRAGARTRCFFIVRIQRKIYDIFPEKNAIVGDRSEKGLAGNEDASLLFAVYAAGSMFRKGAACGAKANRDGCARPGKTARGVL